MNKKYSETFFMFVMFLFVVYLCFIVNYYLGVASAMIFVVMFIKGLFDDYDRKLDTK